jgi:hypothetical protein
VSVVLFCDLSEVFEFGSVLLHMFQACVAEKSRGERRLRVASELNVTD